MGQAVDKTAEAPQEECSTPTLSVFLLVTRRESPISNRKAFRTTFYCYIGTTGWGAINHVFLQSRGQKGKGRRLCLWTFLLTRLFAVPSWLKASHGERVQMVRAFVAGLLLG